MKIFSAFLVLVSLLAACGGGYNIGITTEDKTPRTHSSDKDPHNGNGNGSNDTPPPGSTCEDIKVKAQCTVDSFNVPCKFVSNRCVTI